MKIDKNNFYEVIRTLPKLAGFKKLTQKQVNGMEAILNEWERRADMIDKRWLAYMLATAYHETATRMYPIEEFGKGKGRKYGKKIKHSGKAYTEPNQLYYGRGFVQLTWYENYELMGRLLNRPLLTNPELALDLEIATRVMFEGMTKGSSSIGDFTGRCLEQYFDGRKEHPIAARAIINGNDKAELIAEYYYEFLKAL